MRIHSVIIGLLVMTAHAAQLERTPKFFPDDPIRVDPDQKLIPMPEVVELSQLADFVQNTFGNKPGNPIPPAANVNTLGEVPDSSWFTNRIGTKPVPLEEIVKGPDQIDGPDTSELEVISGKTEGITPGMRLRDARGEIYFVKFDPKAHPKLVTSSEVIVTKFFHAFGYNVPENYLASIRRENLRISPEARFTDENGRKRAMEERDIDRILAKVPIRDDGSIEIIASRRIGGKELGSFKYIGTRSDDPNDIFNHEDRRELRGLRLFAAWLNHDDSRAINTKDFFQGEPEAGYVKHYLIDFGSCLGSGSVAVQSRRAGNEYRLEWIPMLKAAATLGLWDRKWRYIDYPAYPGTGRFEGDYFQPHLWRPEYPNPAFQRMRLDDAFWAVRRIIEFSDEHVRALVGTGSYAPEAAEYLISTLIKRRDKIVKHYLSLVNPLSDFRLVKSGDATRLSFRNLGQEVGLGEASGYRCRWSRFDNETHLETPLDVAQVARQPLLEVPRESAEYLLVEIETICPEQKKWGQQVRVYMRTTDQVVVGIERDLEE
jgi:hypothetical protein